MLKLVLEDVFSYELTNKSFVLSFNKTAYFCLLGWMLTLSTKSCLYYPSGNKHSSFSSSGLSWTSGRLRRCRRPCFLEIALTGPADWMVCFRRCVWSALCSSGSAYSPIGWSQSPFPYRFSWFWTLRAAGAWWKEFICSFRSSCICFANFQYWKSRRHYHSTITSQITLASFPPQSHQWRSAAQSPTNWYHPTYSIASSLWAYVSHNFKCSTALSCMSCRTAQSCARTGTGRLGRTPACNRPAGWIQCLSAKQILLQCVFKGLGTGKSWRFRRIL